MTPRGAAGADAPLVALVELGLELQLEVLAQVGVPLAPSVEENTMKKKVFIVHIVCEVILSTEKLIFMLNLNQSSA